MKKYLLLGVIFSMALACGGNDNTEFDAALEDAKVDAVVDAKVDAVIDAEVDAVIDAEVDAVIDASNKIVCQEHFGTYELTQKVDNSALCQQIPDPFECTFGENNGKNTVLCPDLSEEPVECMISESDCICHASYSFMGLTLDGQFDLVNNTALLNAGALATCGFISTKK